jgi:hypothetical protein
MHFHMSRENSMLHHSEIMVNQTAAYPLSSCGYYEKIAM